MAAEKAREAGETLEGDIGLDSKSEEEELESPHVAELRRQPKDPRTKAKYNIFSRLLFL